MHQHQHRRTWKHVFHRWENTEEKGFSLKKKKKIFCEMMRGKREKMVRILNTTALRSLCICPRFIFSFFHILHNVLYLLNSLM
jgi:hypothetical protein